MSLYEKTNKLRLTAAVLYDIGTAQGLSEEEKAKSLLPIRESYDQLILHSVETDLGEVIRAIQNHELDEASELKRVKTYQEKAHESRSYALTLKELLKQKMIRENLTEKMEAGYSVTLVDGKVIVR